jgi:hypothetical protein
MINGYSYNEKDEILTVEFKSEKRYIYLNVTKQDYQGLVNSFSKGRYIRNVIIPHHSFGRI